MEFGAHGFCIGWSPKIAIALRIEMLMRYAFIKTIFQYICECFQFSSRLTDLYLWMFKFMSSHQGHLCRSLAVLTRRKCTTLPCHTSVINIALSSKSHNPSSMIILLSRTGRTRSANVAGIGACVPFLGSLPNGWTSFPDKREALHGCSTQDPKHAHWRSHRIRLRMPPLGQLQ